jgi:hypothetical protein
VAEHTPRRLVPCSCSFRTDLTDPIGRAARVGHDVFVIAAVGPADAASLPEEAVGIEGAPRTASPVACCQQKQKPTDRGVRATLLHETRVREIHSVSGSRRSDAVGHLGAGCETSSDRVWQADGRTRSGSSDSHLTHFQQLVRRKGR